MELFGVGGIYILRIHDFSINSSALKVAADLPPDAHTLIFVTPNDTKAFQLGGAGHSNGGGGGGQSIPHQGAKIGGGTIMPDGSEAAEAATSSDEDPMESAMKLAAEAEDPEKPVNKPRGRRRDSAESSPNSDCGRCAGSGSISIIGANGEPDSATCPVCKGKGAITRYGGNAAAARPSRSR